MEGVWLEGLGVFVECVCTPRKPNHYHLFWACPKVNAFWRKIYSELVTIFGMAFWAFMLKY